MVQGSGYRSLVKSYANRRGTNGLVRNLNDGKVEIFCEGSRDSIEQLMKDINVKGSKKAGKCVKQLKDKLAS